jgi:hypothetical protein
MQRHWNPSSSRVVLGSCPALASGLRVAHSGAQLDVGEAMRGQEPAQASAQGRLLMAANMDSDDSPGDLGLSTIDDQGAPIGLEERHAAPWAKDPCHLGYGGIGVSDVLERALAATCVEGRVGEWEEGCAAVWKLTSRR